MIISGNSSINKVYYNGYTISKIYACGGSLVWSGDTPTPPTPSTSDYLTIIPRGNGQIKLNTRGTNTFHYSFNSGATWNNATSATSISMNNGTPLWFKGVRSIGPVGTFSANTQFEVAGNPMSLIYGDNFSGETSIHLEGFRALFEGCNELVSIDGLVLPATELGQSCYLNMFYGCTSLTSVPSGLLPARTLSKQCYYSMFVNCTSLTSVPSDFLQSTALENECYFAMFQNCSSLTTAPELPAATLANGCYEYMFKACTQLDSITCLATDVSASNCTSNWVNGVAANGTFTKAQGFLGWVQGVDGIPQGWTVQET